MAPSFEIQDMLPPALAVQDLGPGNVPTDPAQRSTSTRFMSCQASPLAHHTSQGWRLSPAAGCPLAGRLPPVGKGHLRAQVPAA